MARISRPALCLVTPGTSRPSDERDEPVDIVELAAGASAAGVDVIQLREPDLPDAALLTLARNVLGAVDRSRTVVLVNDRVDVALAAGADGVHLPAAAVRAQSVRHLTPPGFIIGRSVHSLDEARQAQTDGAVDYLIFGTVFASARKPAGHAVAGLDALKRVCATVDVPVLAIGGLTPERASQVAAAGAAGVAAIGMFLDAIRLGADQASALVERIRRAFDTRRDVV